jgi:hypothetical protein
MQRVLLLIVLLPVVLLLCGARERPGPRPLSSQVVVKFPEPSCGDYEFLVQKKPNFWWRTLEWQVYGPQVGDCVAISKASSVVFRACCTDGEETLCTEEGEALDSYDAECPRVFRYGNGTLFPAEEVAAWNEVN